MTQHRFFVKPEQISAGQVTVCGPQARQICSVLRLGVGDSISVLDGSGCCHIARISEATTRQVAADITDSRSLDTEPAVKLTLAQALPKGDKVELIVQKATELGISEMIVFTSERTIPKLTPERARERKARWESIAREAAEQSFRATIPAVTGILSFYELLNRFSDYNHVFLAWEEESDTLLRDAIRDVAVGEKVVLIVGPEGGFSETEAHAVIEAGGAPVSFGKTTLRAETAAIAGCAIISHCAGEEPQIP